MSTLYFCSLYPVKGFISVLARQSLLVAIYVFFGCLISVLGLPPESFPCGSSKMTCERWGYDACVFRDGEHYCLPCSHEYLRTLCGKKEEIQGCNRFCTELALAKETEKLQSEFSRQQAQLQANYLQEKTYLQSDFERQLKDQEIEIERSRKDVNRTKLLESELIKKNEDIKHRQIIIIALSTVLGWFALVCVILAVWLWRKRCCCGNKKTTCSEIPEVMSHLLSRNEVTCVMELHNQQTLAKTRVQEKSVQTDGDTDENVVNEQELQKNDGIHQNDAELINDCPGLGKLKNIPPTYQNGFDKMAIQGHDHDFPPNISN